MTRKIEIIQSQPQLYIEYNRADNLEDKGLLLQNLGNGTAEIIDFTIHRNRKQYEDTISNGYKLSLIHI